jgi:hypothetical protein
VRHTEPVDLAVVVHAFLLAELDSSRFGAELRAALARADSTDALVREADLSDREANERRRAVLDDYRGDYLGRNLDSLAWSRALYASDEVLAIRTIAWDFWLDVTDGTRSVTRAAEHFRGRGDDERFVPGGPPLIVVRADGTSHTMVVEGHGRLVALAMHPEELPTQLEVLLGEGASIRRWSLY